MRRWIIRLLILDLIISIIWFGWPFLQSSKTQVSKQQSALLRVIEKRKWPEINLLIAPDYKDQWDQSRDQSLSVMKQLLGGFFVFTIDMKSLEVSVDGKTAKASGTMKMTGSGAGVSAMVMDAVNKLNQPFSFTWRKDGWKPSDWKLVSIAQPELEGALDLADQ
jgi:hypothetical protein